MKILRIPFSLLLLLFLTTCDPGSSGDFTPRAVFLHINDVYRLDPVSNGEMGGLGRVATLVNSVKKQGLPVFVFHAGDFLFPSLESSRFDGLQMIDALNYLDSISDGLFAVPGNHEFDSRKPDVLANAVKASNFEWIGSNLSFETGDSIADRQLMSNTFLDVEKMKIGLFGITIYPSSSREIRDFVPRDSSYSKVARKQITELDQLGADIILGLTHVNFCDDLKLSRLKASAPKFRWIAGGHEHDRRTQQESDQQALVTKGASNAREIWKVTLGENRAGEIELRSEWIAMTRQNGFEVDPDYSSKIEVNYRRQLKARMPEIYDEIGTTSEFMDGREESLRSRETNWGDFLLDIMRDASDTLQADMAFLNSGTLRIDDAFTGSISNEHVERTFAYPTPVRYVWMKGSDIKDKILGRGLSAQKRGDGRFLQMSGARISFDTSKPQGSRVVEFDVRTVDGWIPVLPDQTYVVAISEFMYRGGDGYALDGAVLYASQPLEDLKQLVFRRIRELTTQGIGISSAYDPSNLRIDGMYAPETCDP